MPARHERPPTLRRRRRGRRAKKPTVSFSALCINNAAFQSETPGRTAFLRNVCVSDLAAGRLRPKVDQIVVEKRDRRLSLWYAGFSVREFRVALGHSPVGHKRGRGDGRTPEGRYSIDGRNPKSRFRRSLHISYPSRADEIEASRAGVSTGGAIMIHGLPASAGWIGKHHAGFDWTQGCIAVTNEEIDEIWELVSDGTPIEIRP